MLSFAFQESADDGDFDISQYAHKEVDRYAVLYDLWCNECAFQESKKNVSIFRLFLAVRQDVASPGLSSCLHYRQMCLCLAIIFSQFLMSPFYNILEHRFFSIIWIASEL